MKILKDYIFKINFRHIKFLIMEYSCYVRLRKVFFGVDRIDINKK